VRSGSTTPAPQPGATCPTGRIATGDPIHTHLITETLRAPGLAASVVLDNPAGSRRSA
jgi:hypothetical protein